MKKALLIAALTASCTPAFAQSSVVLYGIVDAGISFDDNGVNGRQGRLQNGFLNGSRWGMRGAEDLGGGLKAVFNLEQALSSDTGMENSYAGQPGSTVKGTGFNRVAYVGLESGWGSLRLGRDYTPFFNTSVATDNMALGLYGSNLSQIALNGGDAENLHRASNGVYYASPNFAGLTLRAVISAGAERSSSPKSEGRFRGVGGQYAKGPVLISAAYQDVAVLNTAGNDTDLRKDLIVGGSYDFVVARVGGGYAQVNPPGASNTASQWWLGGTVPVGRGTIRMQFSRMELDRPGNQTKPQSKTVGIGYVYPFSRQTAGYVTYGKVWNNSAASFSLYAAAASLTAGGLGADPNGFGIGIRKLF